MLPEIAKLLLSMFPIGWGKLTARFIFALFESLRKSSVGRYYYLRFLVFYMCSGWGIRTWACNLKGCRFKSLEEETQHLKFLFMVNTQSKSQLLVWIWIYELCINCSSDNLAGCCSACYPKDCAATQKRVCCSASPLPYPNCRAWSHAWGFSVSCWDCWKAHQIQDWWIQN